jgi:hypothetical protein
MNTRILVPLGLLGLLVLLGFWLLGPGTESDRQAEPVPEPAARTAPESEPQDLERLETPLASTGPETGLQEARREAPEETEELAPRWPAEDTRWLDVRLLSPEETPREEAAWVLALPASVARDELHGAEGPVVALHAGDEPARIEGILNAVSVGPTGEARIGLPPDAEEVWLAVAGSYLYSLEPQRIAVDEIGEAVELRPVLGAWISGRLLAPADAPEQDLADVEVALDWSISAALKLGTAGSDALDLETRTDAEGRFEFRAVPVGKPQSLTTESPTLAVTFGEEVTPTAGEHVEVELAMLLGGRMFGRIVDETGEPVAGAEVHALGREFFGNPTARLRETESDAEGRFELAGVTPGTTWLRVRHDGFQDFLGQSFELADGEEHDHGDVALDQGLTIAGTVVFPDGAPATGTTVRADPDLTENVAGNAVDPRTYIGAGNDAEVDEEGAFRITGLGPGPWALSAHLAVEVEEEEGGRARGRWSTNQSVVHAPREELHLVLEAPVHVGGGVVDGAGEPVSAFRVRAERAGSQWYMPPSEEREEEFESEDGRFLLSNLRAGDWTFTAEGEGYAASAKAPLSLPSEEELTFVLYRPVRLVGEVHDPDGRPVAGAEVSKELEVVEVFQAQQGRGDWPTARSDETGRFALEDLAPGAGSVVAKLDGFAPSAAVGYELSEGEESSELVLTLRRGGTISGEVFGDDGKPAAGCLLILQMPTLQERRIINAGSDGTFDERGLTPGTWQVQAFPGVESLRGEGGETLDQATLLAALKMTAVELADEVEEHVVLGEPPAKPVQVHGRVTLAGEPVGESVISFVPTSGGGMEYLRIESLDADARYALQLDAPGDYLVTIQSTSDIGRQNTIEFRRSVPETGDFELDFEMPLGRISGRVRGPDGEPVPHARVTLNIEGGLVFGTVLGGQFNEASTDENGDYELPYLRPGRYSVAAGGAFLAGFLGDREGLGRAVQTVEVGEGQSVRGVDFQLEDPGSIHGTVRDAGGALVENAAIFVRDEAGHLLELFSVAQTNASGTFEYLGLAPGDYTVVARTSALASPAAVPVRVRAGESSEVTVAVDAGTLLLVTLVDKSGADVPSRVSVLDAEGREMNGMLGLAEIMERYGGGVGSSVQRVGPLPPGSYRVRAFAEDGRSTERPVTLSGKAERKVRLRLK